MLKFANGGKLTKGGRISKGGKWSAKYKKSINCSKPKGFSQKQYCQYGRNKTRKIRK
jgi:hypothetical protein